MKVLVTGAGGFIGRKLCSVLEKSGFEIVPVFRAHQVERENGIRNTVYNKNIDAATNWTNELIGVEVVVHLAARVHVMHGGGASGLADFRDINVEGTKNLAKQAAQSGVKRFVYLSSIKVNGESTDKESFSADQDPKPEDSYATSKLEAEIALREIEREMGIDVVIIRPPLVYGPGVKGNLAVLASMIKKGVPLPLGAVNNRRNLVSIYNLCDLIRVCCLHPAAVGNTFLVSDSEPISTVELVQYLAKGYDRKARLFFVPIWALKLAASILGKTEAVEKLTGNLQIDISATQELLDWTPPFTVDESFRQMFVEG